MMEEINLSDDASKSNQNNCLQPQISVDYGPPDPQIQIELERLNTCTDLINKLEVDLDEGRMMFRQLLSESTQTIDSLSKKLGKCVEQARPYYDARIRARQSMNECQKSAVRFERAVSQHTAAREMVQLAEEGLLTRGCIFDSTWQEMLNHATTKVNDAEKEKIESTNEHREKSVNYHEAEQQVKVIQKDLKRAISKSRSYFEMKATINQRLEKQKKHIKELEEAVTLAKAGYAEALINLEMISDQIHKERENKGLIGIRGVGVGAESSSQSELNHEAVKLLHYSPVSEDEQEEAIFLKSQSGWLPGSTMSNEKLIEPTVSQKNSCNWQFFPPRELSGSNCLTVNRESVISDTESLTSIEMLSEEAIASLMLDNKITDVSESLECLPGGNIESTKESNVTKYCITNVTEYSQSDTKSSMTNVSNKFSAIDELQPSSSQFSSNQSQLSFTKDVSIGDSNLRKESNPEDQVIRPASLTLKSSHCNVGNSGVNSQNSEFVVATDWQLTETTSNSSSGLPSNSSAASNCSSVSSPGDTFQGYLPLEHFVED